jgi:hypothetical protein
MTTGIFDYVLKLELFKTKLEDKNIENAKIVLEQLKDIELFYIMDDIKNTNNKIKDTKDDEYIFNKLLNLKIEQIIEKRSKKICPYYIKKKNFLKNLKSIEITEFDTKKEEKNEENKNIYKIIPTGKFDEYIKNKLLIDKNKLSEEKDNKKINKYIDFKKKNDHKNNNNANKNNNYNINNYNKNNYNKNNSKHNLEKII